MNDMAIRVEYCILSRPEDWAGTIALETHDKGRKMKDEFIQALREISQGPCFQ